MRLGLLLRVDSSELPFVRPSGPLYRIARKPDPWRPPDWASVDDDLTFGNRFDDSDGIFRVLYASSSALGCYLETLARFRRAPGAQNLAVVLSQISDAGPAVLPPGVVPGTWLPPRTLGMAFAQNARFADIYSSGWLGFLRREFEVGRLFQRFSEGLSEDFDLAVLMSQRRPLTQQVATLVYRLGYDGVYYQSRHGVDIQNWALFEPFDLKRVSRRELDPFHPAFVEALRRLNLNFAAEL